MPKMGDAMEEGTLIQWLKQDGETVVVGDVIAEIETDKSNVEIEAEDAGVLHIQAQPGAIVLVGKAIAMIGEDAPKFAAVPVATAAPAEAAAPSCPIDAAPSRRPQVVRETSAPLSAHGTNGTSTNGTTRLKASPLARSVARQRGLDIAQIQGTGPLGRIIEADVLAFAGSKPAARTGDARHLAEERRHDADAADRADRIVRHAESHRASYGREQDHHSALLYHLGSGHG